MRNTLRFLLGGLADYDPQQHAVAYESLPALDRYALSRLSAVMAEAQQYYDEYQVRVYRSMWLAFDESCGIFSLVHTKSPLAGVVMGMRPADNPLADSSSLLMSIVLYQYALAVPQGLWSAPALRHHRALCLLLGHQQGPAVHPC